MSSYAKLVHSGDSKRVIYTILIAFFGLSPTPYYSLICAVNTIIELVLLICLQCFIQNQLEKMLFGLIAAVPVVVSFFSFQSKPRIFWADIAIRFLLALIVPFLALHTGNIACLVPVAFALGSSAAPAGPAVAHFPEKWSSPDVSTAQLLWCGAASGVSWIQSVGHPWLVALMYVAYYLASPAFCTLPGPVTIVRTLLIPVLSCLSGTSYVQDRMNLSQGPLRPLHWVCLLLSGLGVLATAVTLCVLDQNGAVAQLTVTVLTGALLVLTLVRLIPERRPALLVLFVLPVATLVVSHFFGGLWPQIAAACLSLVALAFALAGGLATKEWARLVAASLASAALPLLREAPHNRWESLAAALTASLPVLALRESLWASAGVAVATALTLAGALPGTYAAPLGFWAVSAAFELCALACFWVRYTHATIVDEKQRPPWRLWAWLPGALFSLPAVAVVAVLAPLDVLYYPVLGLPLLLPGPLCAAMPFVHVIPSLGGRTGPVPRGTVETALYAALFRALPSYMPLLSARGAVLFSAGDALALGATAGNAAGTVATLAGLERQATSCHSLERFGIVSAVEAGRGAPAVLASAGAARTAQLPVQTVMDGGFMDTTEGVAPALGALTLAHLATWNPSVAAAAARLLSARPAYSVALPVRAPGGAEALLQVLNFALRGLSWTAAAAVTSAERETAVRTLARVLLGDAGGTGALEAIADGLEGILSEREMQLDSAPLPQTAVEATGGRSEAAHTATALARALLQALEYGVCTTFGAASTDGEVDLTAALQEVATSSRCSYGFVCGAPPPDPAADVAYLTARGDQLSLVRSEALAVSTFALSGCAIRAFRTLQAADEQWLCVDDNERYSIQASPATLRNILMSSAPEPLGHPVCVAQVRV